MIKIRCEELNMTIEEALKNAIEVNDQCGDKVEIYSELYGLAYIVKEDGSVVECL